MVDLWSLERSRDDARIAGVCGALATRWRVDPLLVRVCAVLAALSGGIGLVLYAFGWLWFPRQGEQEAPIHRLLPATKSWPRTAVLLGVAIICGTMLTAFGGSAPFGLVPLVVVGVIAWVYRRPSVDSRDQSAPLAPRPPSAPADTPFLQAARDWQQRVQDVRSGRPDQSTPPQDDPPPSPSAGAHTPTAAVKSYLAEPDPVGLYAPHPTGSSAVTTTPRRRTARLWWVALALVGLVSSGLAIADAAGATIPASAYLAGVALALGMCLVVSAFTGRPRWLIAATIVASLTALASTAPSVPTPTLENDGTLSYTQVGDIPTEISRDSGRLVLDLSKLTVDEDRSVTIRVDAGSVLVHLPKDQTNPVAIHATTDFGRIVVNGRAHHGQDLVVDESFGNGDNLLRLDLHTDAGMIEVDR